MIRTPGLFDVDARLRRLSDIGDQLEAYASAVDFEIFRSELEGALAYSDGAKGGRPPFDAVMMFKILIIQAQNNLGDDRAEFRKLQAGRAAAGSASIASARPCSTRAAISGRISVSRCSRRMSGSRKPTDLGMAPAQAAKR